MGGQPGQGQSAGGALFKSSKPTLEARRMATYAARLPSGPGFAVNLKDAEGRDAASATVRRVGTKTFYFKDDGWIDSAVGPEELGKAVVLKQFSDDFFTLARTQSAEQNQYLTFAERVTVKLDGKIYRVEPGAP